MEDPGSFPPQPQALLALVQAEVTPLALHYGTFLSVSPPAMPQSTTSWLSLLETPESSAVLTLVAPSAVLGPSSMHTSFLAFLIPHCDCRLARSSPLLDCKPPK